MQLVVITAPTSTPQEVTLCNGMQQAGLRRLHLRKPGWDARQAREFLSRLDRSTLQSVVLHDWHELAADFPVKVLCSPCLPRQYASPQQLILTIQKLLVTS